MSRPGSEPPPRARRMWRALEPYHAVTYFAPESKTACDGLGTKGYWMSYFGLRAAPLGPASAELVTAVFYSFHAGLVGRAVPDVWRVASPETFLAIRLAAVDAALRRQLGDTVASAGVVEAAELAREAAGAASTAGRPLGAANLALAWPEEPHLLLWQAQTVLREHRGDGHVTALLTADLGPCEALVLFVADNGLDATWLRERRGWSEEDWSAAAGRLAERGLLDGAGVVTDAGRVLRAEVERCTDELAGAPWAALGDARAERLLELARPLSEAIIDAGGFPRDNPMALRPLA